MLIKLNAWRIYVWNFVSIRPPTALFLDVVRISGLTNVDKIIQHPDQLATEKGVFPDVGEAKHGRARGRNIKSKGLC
jgi:hypothetical protein